MYRSLSPIDNYTFKLGLKVKVINTETTSYAKLGEVGTLIGDCNYPEHPGYPSRGGVVRFKGWNLFPIPFLPLRREEHLFEWQIELIE